MWARACPNHPFTPPLLIRSDRELLFRTQGSPFSEIHLEQPAKQILINLAENLRLTPSITFPSSPVRCGDRRSVWISTQENNDNATSLGSPHCHFMPPLLTPPFVCSWLKRVWIVVVVTSHKAQTMLSLPLTSPSSIRDRRSESGDAFTAKMH